jgi:hypothetical protein
LAGRIRVQYGRVSASGKAICNKKKKGIFMFEELDVFFVGIKDSPGAYGGPKKEKIFINFFVIKL